MTQLTGKVAIVTGSGRGIGQAVARRFAAEGARLVVNTRTTGSVAETVRLISQSGGEVIAVAGDVATPGVAGKIVQAAVDRWGTVDILVNNAAIIGPIAPLGSEDTALWQETLRINVFGPYLMTRAVVPVMQKAKRGKIIDVSSSANRGIGANLVAYRTSKAALLRMSTVLAEMLAPLGIEVNSLDVHATTPMVQEMATWDAQDPVLAARFRQRLKNGEPTPEDNAELFAWLASDRSNGLYGRNICYWMNVADLDRVKAQIIADPRALRMEMVEVPGINPSEMAKAYEKRKGSPFPR
ncbi:MAG: SDR family oxidoreductase [Opitutus sp.]|nr:SDR family oxidoreductase [Opitutus sp.]